MKLSTSLVAVKKIKSNIDASHFSQEKIEEIANLILQTEGVINPLILQRLSKDSYEVIYGDLEYYAAVRAKEKDSLKGEMIGAFIIDSDNENLIKKQVELLRKDRFSDNRTSSEQTSEEVSLNANRIEQKLEFLVTGLAQVIEKVSNIEQNLLENQQPKRNQQQKNTVKPEKSGYAAMTIPQLKKLAKEKGIQFSAKIKKGELIAALESK